MDRTHTTSGESEGREALAPANAVQLQVYLWAGEAASEATVPPPAFAMVADLLQVRGGELHDLASGSIAASFADTTLAMNAARNLQRLVQGFSRAWQGGVLGGCTVLMRGGQEARDSVDTGSLRSNPVLRQTHPGQVIVVGVLCDAAKSIPGVEFRPISGIARRAMQLLPPQHLEGFVEEPFEPRAIVPEPPAVATEITGPVSQPLTPRPPAYVLPSKPVSGSMPAVSGTTRTVPAALVAEDTVGAFSREEKPASGTGRWAIFGGIGAVVVAGVLIFTPILRRPSHPAPAPAHQTEPVQPETAPSQPPPAATDSVSAPSEVRTPTPVVSTKAKANDATHGKEAAHAVTVPAVPAAPEPAPAEDIRPVHGLTFTPAEISSLIAHADSDSGNGNFDKAIQEYKLVLSREPSNDLAKRGLARAVYNKAHQ